MNIQIQGSRSKLARGRSTKLKVLVGSMMAVTLYELATIFCGMARAITYSNPPLLIVLQIAGLFLLAVPVIFLAVDAVEGVRCISLRYPVSLESFRRVNALAFVVSMCALALAFVVFNAAAFLSSPDEYLPLDALARNFQGWLPMIAQTVLTALGKWILRNEASSVGAAPYSTDEKASVMNIQIQEHSDKNTRGRSTKLKVLVAFMSAVAVIELFAIMFMMAVSFMRYGSLNYISVVALLFMVVPVAFMFADAVEGLRSFSLRYPAPLESFRKINSLTFGVSLGFLVPSGVALALAIVFAVVSPELPEFALDLPQFLRDFILLFALSPPMIIQTVLTVVGKRLLEEEMNLEWVWDEDWEQYA